MLNRLIKRSLLFLKRDLFINISYRFQFIFSIVSIFVSVFVFFLLSSFLEGSNEYLKEYGDDYFYFLLVGITITDLSLRVSNSLNIEIRNYQVTGIFEELINTKIPISELLMYSFLYPIFFSLFRMFIFFIFAILFFGLTINLQNFGFVFLAIFFTLISFIGIGLIAGAYTISFKKGNPMSSVTQLSIVIISGIIFPIDVLPVWLQAFSNFIPITHSAELLRYLFLENSEINDFVFIRLFYLILSSLILITLGNLLINLAIKTGKKNGTLMFY